MKIKNFAAPIGLVIVLTSLGFLPNTTQAALYDVTLTGTLTDISHRNLESQFSLGQTMSASFRYESSTPGSTCLAPCYYTNYISAITGGSFDVGSYTGSVTGGHWTVLNDDPDDGDVLIARTGVVAPDVGGSSAGSFNLRLQDLTGGSMSSWTLPIDTTDLSGFSIQQWGISFGGSLTPGAARGIRGDLTSIDITEVQAVPLPPAIWLFMSGILGLLASRHRSQT